MRRMTKVAAAVVVVLATGGMTATAWADDGGTGTAPATGSTGTGSAGEVDWAARLDRACARVDKQLARAQKVRTRIDADASSKGSIAFLQARIDRATQAGQADLAKVLELRLQMRRQIADQLPQRIDLLQQAQQTCSQAGK